jgi:glycosyltransferase involved in cell wall biosynthesis
MRRSIVIIAPFCLMVGEASFNRFLFLAKMLAEQHFDVTLVTSKFRHFDKQFRSELCAEITAAAYGIKVVYINEVGYTKNIGIKRAISHWLFGRNFAKWWASNKTNFDLIYSAYPLIFHNVLLCKTRSRGQKSIPFVIDIQDTWPESVVSAFSFLKKVPVNWFPFSSAANYIYNNVDYIFAVSTTYLERAFRYSDHRRGTAVYIGSDFETIESIVRDVQPTSIISLFYIGTLSYSYDLESVILGLDIVREQGFNVVLHIFGAGPDETRLRSISGSGITFHGLIPFADLIKDIKKYDIGVNCIHDYAPQSVTNKISDYLAIGCPIMNSQSCPEVLGLLSDRVAMHYNSGQPESFAKSLIDMIINGDAKVPWKPDAAMDRRIIYQKIINKIRELLSAHREVTP